MRGLVPIRASAALGVALAVIAAAPTQAQERRDLLLAADSLLGQGDSAAARLALTDAVKASPQSAAAWNARGVLAWHMARAEDRVGYMKRVANDTLLRIADSSLTRAVKLAPDEPRYLVDLGRFDLTSNSASTRGRASDLFEHALLIARKRNDSLAIASASDEMGMTWWRHYVDRADKSIYSYII